MDLFKPVKLGAFQLQHRVVISPPYRAQGGDQKYFESLAPEGGLVLVPPYPVLDVKTHQAIVEAIHKAGGIAFCRVGDTRQRRNDHVANAIQAAYNGVEIDAGEGTILQQTLHGQSPSEATAYLVNLLQLMIKVIPAEKIGIRFAPFAGIEGSYLVDPLSVYVSFVEEIKQHFPTLAFVHFVGDTRLDDFEYAPKQSLDVFRAALAFPYGMHEDVVGPHFVSSGAYSSEQAHAVAAKTTDLVCI